MIDIKTEYVWPRGWKHYDCTKPYYVVASSVNGKPLMTKTGRHRRFRTFEEAFKAANKE